VAHLSGVEPCGSVFYHCILQCAKLCTQGYHKVRPDVKTSPFMISATPSSLRSTPLVSPVAMACARSHLSHLSHLLHLSRPSYLSARP